MMKTMKRTVILLLAVLLCTASLTACNMGSTKVPMDGLSAYELAVENGYEGSVEEWLSGLVGKDGVNGKDGLSAYQLAVAEGYQGTLEDWLESLQGERGEKGEKGEKGADGVGIQKIEVIAGELVITYTNGEKVNLGSIVTTTPSGTTSGSGGSSSTPTEPTPTLNNTDDLPDLDMNAESIIIRSFVQDVNAGSFDAERDGDLINNAVYDRNSALEQRLNCSISVLESVGSTNTSTLYEEMKFLAGQKSYHLVTASASQMVRMSLEGMMVDLASQDRIDLDKDYYDNSYNDALNVGGRQYLVTGKLTYSWYRYQIVTFFNRNLFETKGITYPYRAVSDNQWTTNAMMQVANQFYIDLNEDVTYDANDQYGYYTFIGTDSSQTDGFMSAWNLRLVQKNEEGYFSIYTGYEPTPWVAAVNDYLDLAGAKGSYASNRLSNDAVLNKFVAQEAAMINYRLYAAENDAMVSLSRKNQGYGVLPLPKASEEQSDYYFYIQEEVLLLGIPNTMTGNDRTYAAHFLEAFASESYNVTIPAYYEKALLKKYIIDQPSHPFLAMIDSHTVVDPVNLYGSGYFGISTTTLRTAYNEIETIDDILLDHVGNDGSVLREKIDALNALFKELDESLIAKGE